MDGTLHYLAHGERRYDLFPVRKYGRPYWEYQAVLGGQIGLVTEAGVSFAGHSLWICEAGFPHGWTAGEAKPAEVLVFHLSPPDEVLCALVRRSGGKLRIPLGPADEAWLFGQKENLDEDWKRETESTPVKVLHLLTGISLMVQRITAYRPSPGKRDPDRDRVEKALYWYRQNLGHNPSIAEAARTVGVSAVHLRRLFRKVRGESPKRTFQRVRLEQAQRMLADPVLTVEAVAEVLDYADASALTRAYKALYGVPPRRPSSLKGE